jgi:hypothetical protein
MVSELPPMPSKSWHRGSKLKRLKSRGLPSRCQATKGCGATPCAGLAPQAISPVQPDDRRAGNAASPKEILSIGSLIHHPVEGVCLAAVRRTARFGFAIKLPPRPRVQLRPRDTAPRGHPGPVALAAVVASQALVRAGLATSSGVTCPRGQGGGGAHYGATGVATPRPPRGWRTIPGRPTGKTRDRPRAALAVSSSPHSSCVAAQIPYTKVNRASPR